MLVQHLLTLAAIAHQSLAHGAAKPDTQLLNKDFSLPDLIQTKEWPKSWASSDDAILEEGRAVLTPKKSTKGSLWSRSGYSLEKSFTAEWTVRSTGFNGKSEGGLAMWFTAEKGEKDSQLYNGPSKFEGLQLLIENNGVLGSNLRAQLNDGSKVLTKDNIHDESFASCLLSYQDSTVPMTVRLTYDNSQEYLLKVQVDNRVCFQTKKVQFPSQKYQFGISADNANNAESFEVLQLKVYDGVVEDSLIPNANPMDQPKYITKVINEKTGQEEMKETSPLEMSNGGDSFSNYDLIKKMNRLEGKILANDISPLADKIEELVRVQKAQEKKLEKIISLLSSGAFTQGGGSEDGNVNTDSFKDFYKMNDKLEQILVQQEKIRETSKNHALANAGGPHVDELVRKTVSYTHLP